MYLTPTLHSPSKGAFVSQSQTLADLIGHLHIRLTDILQRHTSAPKGDIVQVEALNVRRSSPFTQACRTVDRP